MKHESGSVASQDSTRAAPPQDDWLQRLQRLAWRATHLHLGLTPARPPVDPANATTLPPQGRGRALREAHRTLRQRLRSLPALRQIVPHLAHIERALRKRGSVALLRLPVPVLQRGLQQLALLQHDDEPETEAAHLRVLRLRLIEAIADRSQAAPARPIELWANSLNSTGFSPTLGVVQTSQLPASGLPGMEVSELPLSAFDDAEPTAIWHRPGQPGVPASQRR